MQVDFQQLDLKLLKKFQSADLRLYESLDRTTSGSITPNVIVQVNLSWFKEKDLILIGVLSWWLEVLGDLVRVSLEEFKLSPENQIKLNLILHSKAGAVEFLFQNYSNRDFFGNTLPRLEKLSRELKILLLYPKKEKRVQRRRGYRDHGSRRPDHRKLEKSDWSLTELQNQIEEDRQADEDTTQFLLGLMGLV
jgi:hypothetical protein